MLESSTLSGTEHSVTLTADLYFKMSVDIKRKITAAVLKVKLMFQWKC